MYSRALALCREQVREREREKERKRKRERGQDGEQACARLKLACALDRRSLSLTPSPRFFRFFPSLFQDYERAFAVFERVVTLQPQNSKAWVSWAQAEKRATAATARDNNSNCCSSGSESNNNENCNGLLPSSPSSVVAVLQAGLSLNRGAPPSARAPLAQAWALHELQRGNSKAAMALLARAVREDPERCSPVLRWAPVVEAAREAAEEEERRRKGEGKKSGSGSGVAAAGPSA